jgi:cytochrome c-type biogenesis protein CcmH/NrfG
MWLGLYYKSLGKVARATVAFRTALELDPENSVAKKYLLNGETENITMC